MYIQGGLRIWEYYTFDFYLFGVLKSKYLCTKAKRWTCSISAIMSFTIACKFAKINRQERKSYFEKTYYFRLRWKIETISENAIIYGGRSSQLFFLIELLIIIN